MKLRYKYRIYPTIKQEQTMQSVGGSVRFIYNHFLKVNIDQYSLDKKFVWQYDMSRQLTALKKQLPWLKDTYSQVLQQSLKDLDCALKNIKKTHAGFPRFKSKYTTLVSFRYQQHTYISEDNKYLYLPKIGNIKIVLHRLLPNRYTGVTITQTARGWYASFVVDIKEHTITDNIHNAIGIDVNSKFTALSTGELISNPQFLKKKITQIKNQQRKLSRKVKKSRNKEKQRNKLARIHDQIRCQRLNHIHQTSARIAKVYDLVAVETLKIDEMRRKNKLVAKAIADAGWGLLFEQLKYKCTRTGRHFVRINQWLPSSKTCSSCGHKKAQLDIKQRTYACEECETKIHRDINAAVNIRNWAIQQWNLDHLGQELPDVPVDVVADIITYYGDMSASAMKQEAVSL